MPTTFTAVSLGQFADLDPNEGQQHRRKRRGSCWRDCWRHWRVRWLMTSWSGPPLAKRGTTISPHGKPTQNFPDRWWQPRETLMARAVSYTATVTYADGTTASVTAVIAQDTNGNAFLVPNMSAPVTSR